MLIRIKIELVPNDQIVHGKIQKYVNFKYSIVLENNKTIRYLLCDFTEIFCWCLKPHHNLFHKIFVKNWPDLNGKRV